MGAKAARQGDLVEHSMVLLAMLCGGCAGIVVGALCALSGGSLAVVIAGVAASGAGGALTVGSLADLIPGCCTGAVATGAPDVFTGADHKPQSRAAVDIATCTGPPLTCAHGTPLIAQGSDGVFVNGFMAARVGDKLCCGGKISTGWLNVYIGGG